MIDRYLQWRRVRAALPFIPRGSHVLDIGCADGALFRIGASRISSGVGIDTSEALDWAGGENFERRTGRFPEAMKPGERFDAVAMLAVLEHLSETELNLWREAIPDFLERNGHLVVTVPSALVDPILELGIRFRLLDGIEAGQHHGFDPRRVPSLFSPGFRVERHRRFELGLNHLFVLKPVVETRTV